MTGADAGLYVLVLLPRGIDEQSLLRAAASRGVWLEGLSSHGGSGVQPGFLLGYGNLSPPDIERGAAAIADAAHDAGADRDAAV